jgi:hypothetical protein
MTKKSLSLSPSPHLSPLQNIKGKKERHLECMLGPSHWLHEISLLKRLGHHFWPGLTALAKNTPTCSVLGAQFILNKKLPGFSNISDPGGYLTNSK